jgi:hypothetical protein
MTTSAVLDLLNRIEPVVKELQKIVEEDGWLFDDFDRNKKGRIKTEELRLIKAKTITKFPHIFIYANSLGLSSTMKNIMA